MKAVYSEPVHRSTQACLLCCRMFPETNCSECLKPKTSDVYVLDFCVGVNCDRANIEFADGSVKNVSVNTLRLIR